MIRGKVTAFREAVISLSLQSDPLVGMSLLLGYEMTMQVVEGGEVTIRAISAAA